MDIAMRTAAELGGVILLVLLAKLAKFDLNQLLNVPYKVVIPCLILVDILYYIFKHLALG